MAQTLQDKYVAALITLKRGKIAKNTNKYIVLESLSKDFPDGKARYYYVGKNGAVRFGKNIATSISHSDLWKKGILMQAAKPEALGF